MNESQTNPMLSDRRMCLASYLVNLLEEQSDLFHQPCMKDNIILSIHEILLRRKVISPAMNNSKNTRNHRCGEIGVKMSDSEIHSTTNQYYVEWKQLSTDHRRENLSSNPMNPIVDNDSIRKKCDLK
jgi:hypothetical protein